MAEQLLARLNFVPAANRKPPYHCQTRPNMRYKCIKNAPLCPVIDFHYCGDVMGSEKMGGMITEMFPSWLKHGQDQP